MKVKNETNVDVGDFVKLRAYSNVCFQLVRFDYQVGALIFNNTYLCLKINVSFLADASMCIELKVQSLATPSGHINSRLCARQHTGQIRIS